MTDVPGALFRKWHGKINFNWK